MDIPGQLKQSVLVKKPLQANVHMYMAVGRRGGGASSQEFPSPLNVWDIVKINKEENIPNVNSKS
jgi:hypothetical protein